MLHRDKAIKSFLFENDSAHLPITGTSMIPFLQPDQIVSIGPARQPLRLGNCYVYFKDNILVIHRLIKKTRTTGVFAGDNNWWTETIPLSSIIGELSTPCLKTQNKIIALINLFFFSTPGLPGIFLKLRNAILSTIINRTIQKTK